MQIDVMAASYPSPLLAISIFVRAQYCTKLTRQLVVEMIRNPCAAAGLCCINIFGSQHTPAAAIGRCHLLAAASCVVVYFDSSLSVIPTLWQLARKVCNISQEHHNLVAKTQYLGPKVFVPLPSMANFPTHRSSETAAASIASKHKATRATENVYTNLGSNWKTKACTVSASVLPCRRITWPKA